MDIEILTVLESSGRFVRSDQRGCWMPLGVLYPPENLGGVVAGLEPCFKKMRMATVFCVQGA